MANVYYNTNPLDQAYRYYTELLELDRASGDKAALSVTYFNLGHVNASRKQFSKRTIILKRHSSSAGN